MLRAPLALLAALALAACQFEPPAEPSPIETAPPFELAPSTAPAPAAPTPWPLPQEGLLAPGARRDYRAAPTTQLPLLVTNPGDQATSVALDVAPVGDGAASPTPTPSGSPSPAPDESPSLPPGPPEPPFMPITMRTPPPDPADTPFDAPGLVTPTAEPTSAPPQGAAAADPLVGWSHVPPTRRVSEVAPLAPGAHASFWINDGDATLAGDRRRGATLRRLTPHAAFWVDDEAMGTVSDAAVARLADAFEQQIRPRLTPVFGEPDVPAGQPVDVVLSPWIGQDPNRKSMMGYFWPRDVLSPGGSGSDLRQHANQRHVVFLSAHLLDEPDITFFGTLAHEYQHLLMFDAKSRSAGTPQTEETWLDEGMAMLAMDLAGYGHAAGDPFVAGEVNAFRHAPAAYSLTDWTHNPNGYSYGTSYLFTRYLYDRFGSGIVHDVQATPDTGVKGLQGVFARRGTSFPQVFVDWARTVWSDPAGLSPTRLTAPAAPKLRPWGLVPLELDGLDDRARALSITNANHPLVLLDLKGGTP